MQPELRTESIKEKVGRGWSYPLGLMDLHAALLPRLASNAWLLVHFSARQAYWKEDRDRVEERRRYKAVTANYSPGGEHVSRLGGPKPWHEEKSPQIVNVHVYALPADAVPHGIAIRPILKELMAESLQRLTPNRLPAGRSPRNAWLLDIELDANSRALEAALRPWNGGEHAFNERVSRKLEQNPLPPAKRRGSAR